MSADINKNDYMNYIWKIVDEVKKFSPPKLDKLIKDENFFGFVFYVLSPAFEEYIVKKFKEEKWEDLSNVDINPNDKAIFPNWWKIASKYLKNFLEDINSGNVDLIINFGKDNMNLHNQLDIFNKLSNKNKIRILKIIYYGMFNFDSISRKMRVKLEIKRNLNTLKTKIK